VNTAARINADYTGTGTSATTTAVAAVASNVGAGSMTFGLANQGILNNSASGTITFGVTSWQRVENLGTMIDASGMLSAVNNYGNITRAYSLNANVYNDDTGNVIDDARAGYMYLTNYGTMTEAYGLSIDYFGTGTVVDSYALHISNRFDEGTGDNFAIYSDADVDSYFKGSVGIGTTAPQQKVHISGALRLEPQATAPAGGGLGDLYVGTDNNLYFHDGANWRQVTLEP
jgi:hypothetical protein